MYIITMSIAMFCFLIVPNNGVQANNDPHFLITSLDSDNTHFCFDVDGGDDDVLQLLQDPDLSELVYRDSPPPPLSSSPPPPTYTTR